jgi:hypothetical protein
VIERRWAKAVAKAVAKTMAKTMAKSGLNFALA